MDSRTIKSKIESLERMTTANGCTAAEAQNAADMASRLRAKLPPEQSGWWNDPKEWERIDREHENARQWFHEARATRPQPPEDRTALWEMFRQAMPQTPDFRWNPANWQQPPYDPDREQSVLNDLDAFLGGERTGKVRF